jgi:hypothetical protein
VQAQLAAAEAAAEMWTNPLLRATHVHQRRAVADAFPTLQPCGHGHFLSLFRYVEGMPERFYCREACRIMLSSLESLVGKNPQGVRDYLSDRTEAITVAYRTLSEVNGEGWHDLPIPPDELELTRFIIQKANPAYLRLVEGVYYPLLMAAAHFSRVARGAKVEGLDVYNCVAELAYSPLRVLGDVYRHAVRNGIAHNGVIFEHGGVRYTDRKKTSTESLSHREMVRLTDDMLDVCNGMALAFRLFYLTRAGLAPMPQQLLLEELQAETDSPWWRVEDWVESRFEGGSQLLLFARPDTYDELKVRFATLQSAFLVEALAPGYDRYFFSMSSAKTKLGMAGFDGHALSRARQSVPPYSDCTGVASPAGYAFLPRRNQPALLRRLDTLRHSYRLHMPPALQDARVQLGLLRVEARVSEVHRTSWGTAVNGDVVVSGADGINRKRVRAACGRIVRAALQLGRRNCSSVNPARFLPLGFARIGVFARDYRARRLSSFGLGADLVCEIQVKRLKSIREFHIDGSELERYGRYRIAWNRAWLDSSRGPAE